MDNRFTKIPCPVCTSNEYKILYKSTLKKKDFSQEVIIKDFKNSLSDFTKHGQIVKCKKCDLVYVNPVENISSYLSGYRDVVDDEYLCMENFRKLLSLKHLKKLERYKKGKELLDVGCFAGFFLELARAHKWNTFGIEPSSWASSFAKKRGTKVLGKTIEKTPLPNNYFDVITLWDVIEHLSNPKRDIAKLSKSLKRGGIIAIGTPDVESLMFKILRGHHPYFIRMHLVLFSQKTLKKLLEQNGFKIIDIYTYGRPYPLCYYLERLETKFSIFKYLRFLKKNKFINEIPITLNLGDEFTILAKKIR